MKFGSVCSGIEAASVAWHPLGWKAAWLSEIEKFPCAVLKHHYSDVPNLGDMTLLPKRILSGEIEAPDVFCGGTPCQAFSVAGLRNSLDDARGNLSLTFCEIANAIDQVRSVQQSDPSIVFWENVPGVLSTKDNAFGCFLGALAGEDDALVPPGGRWTNAGFIDGPQRAVAWRVLDAQYFGVAQRRRRVFVVASARADFDPAAVLFEFDGLRRDTAPRRETGQDAATSAASGLDVSCIGTLTAGFGKLGAPEIDAYTALPAKRWPAEISSTLDTTFGSKQGLEDQHVNAGCPMFVPAQAIPIDTMNMTPGHSSGGLGFGQPGDPSFTLTKGHSHAVAQAIPIHDQATRHAGKNGEKTIGKGNGLGIGQAGEPMNTLTKGDRHAVAQPVYSFIQASAQKKSTNSVLEELSNTLTARAENNNFAGGVSMAVRRLTPIECERLQGFPDNYTNIPWRKAAESPDGPRYKALGNSMAVPVMAPCSYMV